MLTILLVALLTYSCLDPLEAPGPDFQPKTFAEGYPNLEFRVRASGISPGSVRFTNRSTGMLGFTWYLGFNDETGYEATSTIPSPTLKYPGNGRYNIRLRGLGTDSVVYWGSEWLEITNMPN